MKKVNKTESKINTKARVASYRELVVVGSGLKVLKFKQRFEPGGFGGDLGGSGVAWSVALTDEPHTESSNHLAPKGLPPPGW